ncbi:MAG: hypothetical protein U0792_01420 [Gemmataceae bacterium]
MPGVRKQGQRVGVQTGPDLNRYERDVECDGDEEGPARRICGVTVTVRMPVVVLVWGCVHAGMNS